MATRHPFDWLSPSEQKRAFMAVKAAYDKATKMVADAKAALEAGDQATHDQKLAEAEAAFAALAEQEPDIPEIHFNLAVVKRRMEKWAEAAGSYHEAVELRPDMLEAYAGAAQCYHRASQIFYLQL